MKQVNKKNILILLFGIFLSIGVVAQNKGMLSINSTPSGAKVFVNGENTGKTTPFQTILSVGNYTYTIKNPGFKDYSGNITIKEDGFKVVNAKLEALNPSEFVLLGITAYPDADIYIDGELVGNRIFTDNLSLGRHIVKIQKEGYLTETKEIALTKDNDLKLNFELKKADKIEEPVFIATVNNTEQETTKKERKTTFYIKPFAGLSTSYGYNSTNLKYTQEENGDKKRVIAGYGDSSFLGGAFGFSIKNISFEISYQHLYNEFEASRHYRHSNSNYKYYSFSDYSGFDTDMFGFAFILRYPKTPIYFKSGVSYRINTPLSYNYSYRYSSKSNSSNHTEVEEHWHYYLDDAWGFQSALGLNINLLKFLALFVEGSYTMSFTYNKTGALQSGYNSNDDEYYNYPYRNSIVYTSYYNRYSDDNYLDYPKKELESQFNYSSINIAGGLIFKF